MPISERGVAKALRVSRWKVALTAAELGIKPERVKWVKMMKVYSKEDVQRIRKAVHKEKS